MSLLNRAASPILFMDFYKSGHIDQYPPNTEKIFTNLTARKSKIDGINEVVFFGLEYFMHQYLGFQFQNFFENAQYDYDLYCEVMKACLGSETDHSHIADLANLGYLPIEIYALPEGTLVPIGVPMLMITNTHPDFFWLPNMLETILSTSIWQACTSATIAHEYRKLLDHYAAKTGNPGFVDYQGHDFSFRGMSSLESAYLSGMGHLLSFKGTDTIPAIIAAHLFYGAQLSDGASVPATEHSVMSAYGRDNEYSAFLRLITEVYPHGIVSIVSDTYNLWTVLTDYINRPEFYTAIRQRNGKVVFRPDSGDPELILCGNPDGLTEAERKGVVQILWETFGGSINEKNYKELDSHVGVIYGDSITLSRCERILHNLEEKGFASTNVVFGIGSYTYQYNTRDTFGFAMKSTYAEINGNPVQIFKDPITDDGTKKSHKGMIKVVRESGKLIAIDKIEFNDFFSSDNQLKLVYKDGKILSDFSFDQIKQNKENKNV